MPRADAGRALGPEVAGTWYPADPNELTAQLDALLAGEHRAAPRVAAILAPHAGYVYSGRVAAAAFREVVGAAYSRVVVLAPSHYAAYDGAAVPVATSYHTPLGPIAIDRDAIGALAGRAGIRLDSGPFGAEHSIEAELPFLQHCLRPGWRLLPVLLGAGSSATALLDVAQALAPLLSRDCLVVVSSDFTHYGPRFGYVPFESEIPQRIERLDRDALELVLALDASGFREEVARTGATICGRSAIDVFLRLPVSGWHGALLGYDTSGSITGDWRHSVSYASVIFHETSRSAGC